MINNRARRLGNDADFQALYRSLCNVGGAALRARPRLTAEGKDALVANLQSGDEARVRTALNAVGASQQVTEEQRRLLRLIANRHHLQLGALPPGTFGEAATAAKWSYSEEHGGGPAPDPLDEVTDELGLPDSSGGSTNDDEPGDNSGCYDGCALLAAGLGASAVATYAIALAACTAAGPFWPVCWGAATGAYVIALYQMDAAVDRCVANCDG